MRAARRGTCQVLAETLAVLCPHCGAEQPAPENGSDLWTPDELFKHQGKRECVSCDEPIVVTFFPHAQVHTTTPPAKAGTSEGKVTP
jgi:hypothetical protein